MACRSSICDTILRQAIRCYCLSITTSEKAISQAGLRADGPWRVSPPWPPVSRFDSRNQMIAISWVILASLSIRQARPMTEAICTSTAIPDQATLLQSELFRAQSNRSGGGHFSPLFLWSRYRQLQFVIVEGYADHRELPVAVPRRGIQRIQSCAIQQSSREYQQYRPGWLRLCHIGKRPSHHASCLKNSLLAPARKLLVEWDSL